MSGQDWDPQIFNDEGELIGEVVVLDDGSGAVVVDNEGAIIDAVDANMQPVDPGEFEFVSDTPAEDPLAEAHARMDALEQRANEPLPTMQYELPEARDQRWATGVNRELGNLQQALGRQLTDAETHGILADHKADWDAGVGVDVFKSARAAGLIDFSPGHDSMNDSPAARHDSRVEFMTAHLEDQTREQRGEAFGEPPARRAEEYDTSTHDGRVAKAMDDIDGHDTSRPAFDYEGME